MGGEGQENESTEGPPRYGQMRNKTKELFCGAVATEEEIGTKVQRGVSLERLPPGLCLSCLKRVLYFISIFPFFSTSW